MKPLLDTHLLIWALAEDEKDSLLPEEAKKLIGDPENEIIYSMVSVWEVAIKHAIHPDDRITELA